MLSRIKGLKTKLATGNEVSFEQLKSNCSYAKGKVTKLVNKINKCLSTKEDSESIEKSGIQLNNILDEFDQAHNTFHQLTKIEELKESEIYLQSVHELVSEVQENSSISGHTY